MMKISNKLIEMLKENTGRHFLDSGGAYGRHWERNQETDFEKQSDGWVEFWNQNGKLDITPTLSLFHFLNNRLDFNDELNEQYREFVEKEDHYFDYHSAVDFVASLGVDDYRISNTYNDENFLSQDIQYVYWEDEDGPHVLLQIHGGCDVRGGYTYPVAFDYKEEYTLFDCNRGVIYCSGCELRWFNDGDCWQSDDDDLDEYEIVDEKPEYPLQPHPNQTYFIKPERQKLNVLWVDGHDGHCPSCGTILEFGGY